MITDRERRLSEQRRSATNLLAKPMKYFEAEWFRKPIIATTPSSKYQRNSGKNTRLRNKKRKRMINRKNKNQTKPNSIYNRKKALRNALRTLNSSPSNPILLANKRIYNVYRN